MNKSIKKIIEAQIDYINELAKKLNKDFFLAIEDEKFVMFCGVGCYECECYVNSDGIQWLTQQIIKYENELKKLEA